MVLRNEALRELVDRERVAADWRARGFVPGQATYPPGRERRDVVRESDELVMVVEGEVEFVIEGIPHRPEPGEELRIPAGARHTIRNCGRATSRWLHAYRT